MIAREVVEEIRKRTLGAGTVRSLMLSELEALLDVVAEADRLTDLLGEFSFDGGACGEQADRLDTALVRLRDA